MKGMHKHAIALLLSASLLQSNVMPLWANTAPSVRETNQVDELDDFSKVLNHSDGWQTVIDEPNNFFGDSSRLIRTEDSAQYLVYQLDNLTDFKVRMHSYLRNLRYLVNIYQSNDLSSWEAVDYTITSAKTSDSAFWGTFDLMPKNILDGKNKYLKIGIKNNENADQTKTVKGSDEVNFLKAVQIGKVELTDSKAGLITNTNTDLKTIKLEGFDDSKTSTLKISENKTIKLINPTIYDVKIESSNPKVVKYENNQIIGVSNGTAYLKGIVPGELEVFRYEIKIGTGENLDISPKYTKPADDTGDSRYIKQGNGEETDNLITVDPDNIIVKDYMGGAMELEMIEWFDMDDARWERYFQRIQYMELGFVRCMLAAYWYCTGFDDHNNPIYVWDCLNEDGSPKYYSRDGYPIDPLGNNIEPNIKRMKRLYQLFDFFKKNNITVMTGEWQYPEAAEWYYVPGENLKQYNLTLDDPRYAQIAADFIEHMVKDKNYTCIEQYDLGNEVNINPGSYQYDKWKQANLNLYDQLKQRGLEKTISLTPDLSYWLDLWYNQSIADLHDVFEQYEFHWYVNEVNLKNGVFENEMRMLVNNAAGQDNPDKKVYMGEVGMRDYLNNVDQVTNIDSFEYGLWMANILVQGTRAGMSGLTAWSLDDSVHINGPMTYDYSVDQKSLMKVWGLWNSLGEYQGVSEDIRPWYVPWALASKFMPKGSQIIYTSPTEQQVYSTAAINGDDLTISVVNHSGKEQQVLVKIPEATKKVDLSVYAYFKDDLNQDENGYPVRSDFKKNLDLQEGIVLTLPADGNLVLTTMEGENKFNSKDSGYFSDSMQSLQNTVDYQNIGFNSYEKHPNNAQNRINMNQDIFGDVTRINRAGKDKASLVYQRAEGIKNFRIHSYVKGAVGSNFKVYGSNDKNEWTEIKINEIEKYSLTKGWKFAVLTPESEIEYKYIKIELGNEVSSTDIQVGKVELTNQSEFSEPLKLEIPDDAQSSEYKEIMKDVQLATNDIMSIYSISDFENLPENCTLKSSDENIVKITDMSFKAVNSGSALVNVYRDGKIIGSIIVNVYAFHDSVEDGNGLVYQLNNMKYDLMADANDTTFSRTNDGGNVIYKLAGIKDFSIRGYVADSNDKLFEQIKIYASKDGNTWESIEIKVDGINALSNPYWHYANIIPQEAITKDYDYLKIAIEGTLTDHWKIQVGDVRIQDKPFNSVVNKIELANQDLKLAVGNSQIIGAKVYPEAVFPFKVIFDAADNEIVSVDKDGLVTGLKAGKTTVRVYSQDNPEIYQDCTIEVTEVIDSSKEIADSIKELTIINNQIVLPVVEGYEITIKSSSIPNIIDLDGKVTPSNQDEQVALVLAVKNKATNVVSDTANIIVTVAKKDETVMIEFDITDVVLKVYQEFDPLADIKVFENDTDITKNVRIISNNVDLNHHGKYFVTYEVTDSKNITHSHTRNVEVRGIKSISCPEYQVDLTSLKDLDPDVFLNIVKVDKQVILDKLNSKLTDDQIIISCYDLAMMLNNKEYVLTDNQLTIVWNVTSKMQGFKVLMLDKDGNVVEVPMTVNGKEITFMVEQLGTFAIVGEQKVETKEPDENKPENKVETAVKTGDEVYYAEYAVLGLLALSLVYGMKKRG